MFKRVPSAGTKADSDLKLIAPTSRPTIGNTIVVRRLCLSTIGMRAIHSMSNI